MNSCEAENEPPQDADDDLVLADLVQELTEQMQRGHTIGLEAVLVEHPQYADRLRKLLPTIEALAAADRSNPTGDAVSNCGDGPAFVGTLGDFQILREIARGGMGIVYEARQISLDRRVALKVLPFAAALDHRALDRFRNESQAAARLDHPHIVHVYGVGVERGVHYYAMQYIEGQSLAEVIGEMQVDGNSAFRNSDCGFDERRGRASEVVRSQAEPGNEGISNPKSPFGSAETPRAAGISTDRASNPKQFYRGVARLAIQVAEALDYAHSRGVLHRDIKPANILIDDLGDAWIADFGLARIGDEGNLTQTGDIVGTLRYASPEQVLAQKGLVDQRSDVYSLGATFYELLTLRPVFHGEDRKKLLQQIVDDDPSLPRSLNPKIPAELETIVLKCLEKEPTDRYATAGDVAAEFQRYLAHEPLVVRRGGYWERLKKWSRRHQPWVMSIMAATTLAMCALAASSLWVLHEREQNARERESTAAAQALAATRQTTLRKHSYITRIRRCETAWKIGDFSDARRLLDECLPESGEPDLRGFEWRLLSQIFNETPRAWRQHNGECYCARFSPAANLLATAGQDGVRVWTWPAGDEAVHLTPHLADVNGIAFSPDGKLLATASDDGYAKIIETRNWTEIVGINTRSQVIGTAFSPDGRLLFTAEKHLADDNAYAEVIHFWRVADGTEDNAIIGSGRGDIQGLAVSPDGRWIGMAGGTGFARFWDLPALSSRYDPATVEIYLGCRVSSVTFAHHHPLWAAADARGGVSIINTRDGHLEDHHPGNAGGVESVSFSTHDDLLVSACRDGTARLWEFTGAGNQVHNSVTYRSTDPLWCAVLSPEARQIVTTSRSGAVTVFHRDRPPGYRIIKVPVADPPVVPIAFSPDGRKLALSDRGVSLLDVSENEPPLRVIESDRPFTVLAYSPEGDRLVTSTSAGCVEVWDTTTWSRTATLRDRHPPIPQNSGATCLAFDRQSRAQFIGDLGGHAIQAAGTQRDEHERKRLVPFEGNLLSISSDGRWMTCSGKWPFLNLHLYEASTHGPVFSPTGNFACATVSRDGAWVAAGGTDGRVTIWKRGVWDEPLVTTGHPARVTSVDFSLDGRTLASAASNGSITLWHADTGQELLTLDGHSRAAHIVCFSPDGTFLASSGTENTPDSRHEIRLWRADGGDQFP